LVYPVSGRQSRQESCNPIRSRHASARHRNDSGLFSSGAAAQNVLLVRTRSVWLRGWLCMGLPICLQPTAISRTYICRYSTKYLFTRQQKKEADSYRYLAVISKTYYASSMSVRLAMITVYRLRRKYCRSPRMIFAIQMGTWHYFMVLESLRNMSLTGH